MASMETNNQNASCLNGTGETASFQQYISKCRSASDTQRANNFFSSSIQEYKSVFESLRAQYDDLIITGDSMNSLVNLAGATTSQANTQIDTLSKRKETLKSKIQNYRQREQTSDKNFLEEIMHKKPTKKVAGTLQDGVLLLFWFGWIVLSIVLITVRYSSPGGSITSAAFSLVLIIMVTVCIFAILNAVA
jgi:Tfp pilus assembly protein PilN